MKILIILILGLSVASMIGCADPDLAGMYAVTPFDRCMEAYKGTPDAGQCELLKL